MTINCNIVERNKILLVKSKSCTFSQVKVVLMGASVLKSDLSQLYCGAHLRLISVGSSKLYKKCHMQSVTAKHGERECRSQTVVGKPVCGRIAAKGNNLSNLSKQVCRRRGSNRLKDDLVRLNVWGSQLDGN